MIGALTGIVSALIYGGYAIEEASILSQKLTGWQTNSPIPHLVHRFQRS
jgi:hypothetical protein